MNYYHVLVEQDERWYIGSVLERDGITTQGRSLDELTYMLRDAIELMWNQRHVQLELIIPEKVRTSFHPKAVRRAEQNRRVRPFWRSPRKPAA